MEYNWKVNVVPILTKVLGVTCVLLTLGVIALEIGLYFDYQEVNLFKQWKYCPLFGHYFCFIEINVNLLDSK